MHNPQRHYVYALYSDAEMSQPIYIGKGSGKRINHHHYPSATHEWNEALDREIQRILRVVGYLPRRKIHENLSEIDALNKEKELIAQLGMRPDGPLFNKVARPSLPSRKGVPFTAEHRRKLSLAAHKRLEDPAYYNALSDRMRSFRIKTPQMKAKISAANRGRKQSEAERQRRAQAQRNLIASGFVATPETRARISAAKRGKPNLKLRGRPRPDSRALMKTLIWITNDITSRRVLPNVEIPDGWRRGKRDKRSRG